MCYQLVTIGSCKHHHFTGLFLKCSNAISTNLICKEAKEATDLTDKFNIILDENNKIMCDCCQFIFDKTDRNEPEPDDETKAADLAGMQMRKEEYERLVQKKIERKEAEKKEKEKKEKEKKELKEAIKNGQVVPQTRKQLVNQICRRTVPQIRNTKKKKENSKTFYAQRAAWIEGYTFHRMRDAGHWDVGNEGFGNER